MKDFKARPLFHSPRSLNREAKYSFSWNICVELQRDEDRHSSFTNGKKFFFLFFHLFHSHGGRTFKVQRLQSGDGKRSVPPTPLLKYIYTVPRGEICKNLVFPWQPLVNHGPSEIFFFSENPRQHPLSTHPCIFFFFFLARLTTPSEDYPFPPTPLFLFFCAPIITAFD